MNLFYVQTNGYDMIVATDGENTCFCTEYYFYDEFKERIIPMHEALNANCNIEKAQAIASALLRNLAEYNSFDMLYSDWTADEPENYPHPTVEELLEGCNVIAEIEA